MCLVIREMHIKLDINPFLIQNDDTNKAKKLEVSECKEKDRFINM